MASIKEVAKLASVSPGTVSRAYNGYSDIKPETKERIFEAARLLNYTPNVNARSLSSKITNNIGVLMGGLLEDNPKDTQGLQLLKGVYRFAQKYNFQISIYAIDANIQKKRSYAEFCQEHNIAGAILSGITVHDPYFKELVNLKVPCVTIDIPAAGKKVGCVSIDNFAASKSMMQYLLQCGHRDIIIIAGKKDATVTAERLAGAEEALQEAGIALRRDRIIYCDYKEKVAYTKTMEYLKKHPNIHATAFFCQSDLMALGVYKALGELGFCVPEDYSVTGFDGHPITEYVTPPITTIAQDVSARGYEAGRLLSKIIRGEEYERHVILPYELIERQSVCRIK